MTAKNRKLALWVAAFGVSVSAPAFAQSCEDAGDANAINNIREVRAHFNEAIARADIEGIRAVLHEDVILITGTNSDFFRGRDAQLELWQGDFDAPGGRTPYDRKTQCVRVSSAFPIALEVGAWRGVREGGVDNFAAGRYAAKWRNVDGAWLIESEIFATEECGGEFCPAETDAEE